MRGVGLRCRWRLGGGEQMESVVNGEAIERCTCCVVWIGVTVQSRQANHLGAAALYGPGGNASVAVRRCTRDRVIVDCKMRCVAA